MTINTVTFFDIETTGLLKPEHRIIEASFRICDFESQTEKRNVLLRFSPERNIDAKSFAVHGISLDDLKGKPTILACFPQIIDIMDESDLIVAHHGLGFDKPFLEMEAEGVGVTLPVKPWFDTMVEGTFATDLGKSPKLQELCFALDVVYDPKLAHKGDYDTEVMRDCFFNGIRHGWFQI